MRSPASLWPCLLCLAPFLAPGQEKPAPQSTASIIGTVVDVQHNTIPAAVVSIQGASSAEQAILRTNNDGFFAFRDLRPGVTYHVSITASGFAAWTSAATVLKPGQELDLKNIQLDIAVVQTTVSAMTLDQIGTEEVHIEEKQRIVGIFPNFYVTYNSNPAPLTTKLKFELALRSTIDPVNILSAAAFAGFNQAADTPDYRQGAKGYGQRLGAGLADGFTSSMIGGAMLPSLFHQDPRYFYQGTGTVGSRVRHVFAFSVLCKGDNGRWQFNYSGVGGDLASGAISDLYYPPTNRDAANLFYNAALAAAGRVANNLAQEFVFRKLTPSAKKHP
ncbi:MAG TPA: carboxypeptidase-like regulatory domain-containing protein [Silvibacterium sp.]|nr:carboxypeptidase-like regulatory domain-containing protein [Silvibacterium sp.]